MIEHLRYCQWTFGQLVIISRVSLQLFLLKQFLLKLLRMFIKNLPLNRLLFWCHKHTFGVALAYVVKPFITDDRNQLVGGSHGSWGSSFLLYCWESVAGIRGRCILLISHLLVLKLSLLSFKDLVQLIEKSSLLIWCHSSCLILLLDSCLLHVQISRRIQLRIIVTRARLCLFFLSRVLRIVAPLLRAICLRVLPIY